MSHRQTRDLFTPSRHRGVSLRAAALPFALIFALGAAACDGGETEEPQGGCVEDPRVADYLTGMEVSSDDGSITLKLADADPSPPTKGDNVWKIEISDAAGPVNDATLAVDAFMPDHGHGSTVATGVTFEGDGVYVLDPINLFMPGVWEITIDVSPPGGTVRSVKLTFCVLG